jgi:hypothetical protein
VEAASVARDFGGGHLGAGAMALIASAGRKLGASDWLFALAGLHAIAWNAENPKAPRPRLDVLAAASRLADAARLDLLTAREIAAREAQARRAASPAIDLGAALARLAATRRDHEDDGAARFEPERASAPRGIDAPWPDDRDDPSGMGGR